MKLILPRNRNFKLYILTLFAQTPQQYEKIKKPDDGGCFIDSGNDARGI